MHQSSASSTIARLGFGAVPALGRDVDPADEDQLLVGHRAVLADPVGHRAERRTAGLARGAARPG